MTNSILRPGYLRWDGTKYVLDPSVEIVGPPGPPGPSIPGPPGPAGADGPAGDASLIYQPGGTASGNVYTSWTALMAKRAETPEVPMTIYIDDSIVGFFNLTLDVGTWDFYGNTKLAGVRAITNDEDPPIVLLTQGVQLVDAAYFENIGLITSPTNTDSTPYIIFSGINNTQAAVIYISGFSAIFAENATHPKALFQFPSTILGVVFSIDGTTQIVAGGNSFFVNDNGNTLGITFLLGGRASVGSGIVGGTNLSSTVTLTYDSPSAYFNPSQTGFSGTITSDGASLYGNGGSSWTSASVGSVPTKTDANTITWETPSGGSGGGNVVIFRPGYTGSQSNIFSTWANTWNAREAISGPVTIYIDNSLLLTSIAAPVTITGDTTVQVASTNGYATSGWFWVVLPNQSVTAVNYTGISGNSFTGCNVGEGTLSVAPADRVWGPATIETSNVTYDLQKQTNLVGFRNATSEDDPWNNAPNTPPVPWTGLVWWVIADTVQFYNPSYFENLLIWGTDSADDGVFICAGQYTTLDVDAKNAHFGNVQGFMFLSPGGTFNLYGSTFLDGNESGWALTCNGTGATYTINMFDDTSIGEAVTGTDGTGTVNVNIMDGAANWAFGGSVGGVGTTNINGGYFSIFGNGAGSWNAASTGYVLTKSSPSTAEWLAAGGGGFTAGNDLSGTSTSQNVIKITGTGTDPYGSGTFVQVTATGTGLGNSTTAPVDGFTATTTLTGTGSSQNLLLIPYNIRITSNGLYDGSLSLLGVDNASPTGFYRADITFTAVVSSGTLTFFPASGNPQNARSNGTLASAAASVTYNGIEVIVNVTAPNGVVVKWSVIGQIQWRL